VLTALAIAVCGLVALEIGTRWAEGVALRPLGGFLRTRLFPFKRSPLSTYDPTLGWTIIPNLCTVIEGDSFATDAFSVRLNAHVARPLPHGGILATGSSYTCGSEVANEWSWPAQLERTLGIPVVNAAAGGWAADQIVLRAEQMLELARPTTVIIAYCWSALWFAEFRTYGFAQKPYFLLKDGALVRHSDPVPLSASASRIVEWLRPVIERSYLAFWLVRTSGWFHRVRRGSELYVRVSPEGDGPEIACLLLDRFRKTVERRGIRLVLLMEYGVNEFAAPEAPAMCRRVIDWARTTGIETVDAWAKMKRLFDEDHERFLGLYKLHADGKTRGHMSETGNRFVADELAAALRRPAGRAAPADTAAAVP